MPRTPCDTPKVSPGRYRDVSKHAVPPGARVYHSILTETSNMKVEEVQRSCERAAHRSGQNFSPAPATAATGAEGSMTCFFFCGKPHLGLLLLQRPAAQLTDKPGQASAGKAPTAGPIHRARPLLLRPPQQIYLQAGSKAPTSAITPLLVTHLAAFVECGSRTSIRLLLPHPL